MFLGLLIFTLCSCNTVGSKTLSESDSKPNLMNTKTIVKESLKLIEKSALVVPPDWNWIKKETRLLIDNSNTDSEVYEALAWCLASLGDSHSFLLDPCKKRVYPTRTVKPKVIFHPGQSKYFKKNIDGGVITSNSKQVGYIYVPGYDIYSNSLSESNFAEHIQTKLQEIAKNEVVGWIVDLRGNAGGNMWPMIAGLGPLTSARKIGSWVNANESADWMYFDGEAYQQDGARRKTNAKCVPKLDLISESIPVAVLIDRYNASSGEAVAICFSGRRNTKFFGEATWGLTTANTEYKLLSGAVMYLTIAYDTDRHGKVFKAGVVPDVIITEEADRDKAKEAAIKWLVMLAK